MNFKNYGFWMINPTLSGMWNGACYPGGGSLWPPPEKSQNKATEACEGSNEGFLGMPSSSWLFG